MYNVHAVQIGDGQNDLGCIEPRHSATESSHAANAGEELAAVEVLHEEVEVMGILEGTEKADDEGMVGVG